MTRYEQGFISYLQHIGLDKYAADGLLKEASLPRVITSGSAGLMRWLAGEGGNVSREALQEAIRRTSSSFKGIDINILKPYAKEIRRGDAKRLLRAFQKNGNRGMQDYLIKAFGSRTSPTQLAYANFPHGIDPINSRLAKYPVVPSVGRSVVPTSAGKNLPIARNQPEVVFPEVMNDVRSGPHTRTGFKGGVNQPTVDAVYSESVPPGRDLVRRRPVSISQRASAPNNIEHVAPDRTASELERNSPIDLPQTNSPSGGAGEGPILPWMMNHPYMALGGTVLGGGALGYALAPSRKRHWWER